MKALKSTTFKRLYDESLAYRDYGTLNSGISASAIITRRLTDEEASLLYGKATPPELNIAADSFSPSFLAENYQNALNSDCISMSSSYFGISRVSNAVFLNAEEQLLAKVWATSCISSYSQSLDGVKPVQFTATANVKIGYFLENTGKSSFYIIILQRAKEWLSSASVKIKTFFKTAVSWLSQFATLVYIHRIPQVLLA